MTVNAKKAVLRRVARLRQLRSPGLWWLFLRVFAFATVVPALFRLRLPVLSRMLEGRARTRSAGTRADAVRARQIIRCVAIARALGRPLVSRKCLTRAVTLYYFLRRAGLELSLCFGAPRSEGRLVAGAGHCWLVRDGEPFLEAQDPRTRFVPIYWLPATSQNTGFRAL